MNRQDETTAVEQRYARRVVADDRYSLLNPAALLPLQERQRHVLALFRRLGWNDLSTRHLLEVGCGNGSNLLECLQMGFSPRNLSGIELLVDRHVQARERLPWGVELRQGDASTLPIAPHSLDVVMQSTVFSSLLDDAFQQGLADAMWTAVRPGGGVLWYDFTFDNPRNPDVRGVPLSRIKALFPHGRIEARRITLAPPINRVVTRLHPRLYTVFNTLPFLRTHLLCWIAKP